MYFRISFVKEPAWRTVGPLIQIQFIIFVGVPLTRAVVKEIFIDFVKQCNLIAIIWLEQGFFFKLIVRFNKPGGLIHWKTLWDVPNRGYLKYKAFVDISNRITNMQTKSPMYQSDVVSNFWWIDKDYHFCSIEFLSEFEAVSELEDHTNPQPN